MTTANKYLEDRVAAIEHCLENDVATKDQVEELKKEIGDLRQQISDVQSDTQEILNYVKP